jgi:hypothetical protein
MIVDALTSMYDSLPPSSELTTVETKLNMLKERRAATVALTKEVNRLLSVRGEAADVDGVHLPVGCFGRLVWACPRFSLFSSSGRVKLSTVEGGSTAAGSSYAATQANLFNAAPSKDTFHRRIFGTQSGVAAQESRKIEVALQTVSARLEALRDRSKIQRERVVYLSNEGKKTEALRELKKAKATDKQVAVAQQALDTLERQNDLLSESVLQKELATALASTNQTVRGKTKGLLVASEKAVDQSQELRDAADDVAAVFEGLAPAHDDDDDDELLAELSQLIDDTTSVSTSSSSSLPAQSVGSAVAALTAPPTAPDRFPSAPTKLPAVNAEMTTAVSAG